MASQDFDADGTPRDIIADLGLAVGTVYMCQNVDVLATLRFRQQPAPAPDPSVRAHRVEAGGNVLIRPQIGQAIYVWTDDPNGCAAILTEST